MKKLFKHNYTKYIYCIIALILCALSVLAAMSSNISTLNASALDSIDLFKNFTSQSVVLLHPDSQTVLYAKNENDRMEVASICKLMTSLITLEKIEAGALSIDDEITASAYAASMEGSQAFLDAGSNYKVKDLLKSVIVASANDSAVVLAEAIAGNEDAFVIMMNQRAKELGMTNTLYANSTGLPGTQQYSTALDTTKILREVGKYSLYNEDSKIWMDEFVHPSGRKTELVNTNRLIRYYDKCINGKTGFTDEAGYCLATTARYKDMDLIAVTLKSNSASNRFKENMELFNYGFANYENKKILDKTEILPEIARVKGGSQANLNILPERDYYAISKKGANAEISTRIEFDKKINAPIKKGDVVGKCIVLKDGVVVGEVSLIAAIDMNKQSYSDSIAKILKEWKI